MFDLWMEMYSIFGAIFEREKCNVYFLLKGVLVLFCMCCPIVVLVDCKEMLWMIVNNQCRVGFQSRGLSFLLILNWKLLRW